MLKHAYFPPSEYDEKVDQVWVKRMFPCVWVFQKRRRAKDYIRNNMKQRVKINI